MKVESERSLAGKIAVGFVDEDESLEVVDDVLYLFAVEIVACGIIW